MKRVIATAFAGIGGVLSLSLMERALHQWAPRARPPVLLGERALARLADGVGARIPRRRRVAIAQTINAAVTGLVLALSFAGRQPRAWTCGLLASALPAAGALALGANGHRRRRTEMPRTLAWYLASGVATALCYALFAPRVRPIPDPRDTVYGV